jgi:hypothetical protein
MTKLLDAKKFKIGDLYEFKNDNVPYGSFSNKEGTFTRVPNGSLILLLRTKAAKPINGKACLYLEFLFEGNIVHVILFRDQLLQNNFEFYPVSTNHDF